MAYIDQYALGEDAVFQTRIQVAILTAALAILGEAIGSFTETQYQKRQALAKAVMANPASYAQRFTRLITTGASVTSATTDATLSTIVNTNWSKVAGVDIND
jgi:hypothetical protein